MPSNSAKWALRVAVFAPVLAVMSILAHRSATIDTPSFMVLLVVILLVSLVALFLVFMTFRSLWVHGKRGGRRATWALFFCALVLSPFVLGLSLWITNPKVTEVSTDLIDPPTFRSELLEFNTRAPTLVAATLEDAYPQITARRYNATIETVYDQILSQGEMEGWTLTNRRGRIGADNDFIAEFDQSSAFLGMPRKIVVRVRDEGETTLVDMRSRSVYGDHDLGSNARLIRSFISDLDFNLIGKSE